MASAAAQSERGPFDVSVERIADGVYVAYRPIPFRYPVLGNVTIVINEDDVVVFDGGGLPAHAEAVCAEIRRLTHAPVSNIVISHWHGDHNLGLSVYRRYWPNARIVAHENTRYDMAHGVMDYVEGERSFDVDKEIASFEARATEVESAGGPESRVRFHRYFAEAMEDVAKEYRRAEIVHADVTFRDRLTLHRGERTLELHWLGNANTDGDAILWLPNERIVVTGDVVVRPTPYGFGSYPTEWAQTLRAIQELNYEILVPGHGDVQRDRSYVDALIALMDDLMRQVRSATAAGADTEEALATTVDFSAHEERIAGEDALLAYLFEIWFKRPILKSALIEATGGEVEPPLSQQ